MLSNAFAVSFESGRNGYSIQRKLKHLLSASSFTGSQAEPYSSWRRLQRVQRVARAVQGQTINFYASRKHRYLRRELKAMIEVLDRVFDPDFTHAVGRHGELMFDAARRLLARLTSPGCGATVQYNLGSAAYDNGWRDRKESSSAKRLQRRQLISAAVVRPCSRFVLTRTGSRPSIG